MTERFSDLWEGVDAPELTGEETTPLDGERVRNLVRARIAPKKARRRPVRTLLLAADTIAKTVAPTELPVRIFTSLLGVPFLLYLIIKPGRETR